MDANDRKIMNLEQQIMKQQAEIISLRKENVELRFELIASREGNPIARGSTDNDDFDWGVTGWGIPGWPISSEKGNDDDQDQ